MNGIINIDKPAGWTSHDVVAKIRGILKEKRVGHSGTLDPMATGVLPVFAGRATRAVQFCEAFDKEYIAGLRLGIVTDTQDTTGTVMAISDVNATRSDVEQAARKFTGILEQLPPMYSAVKIGGQKLYQLARRGIEAERTPRQIIISAIDVLDQNENEYLLRIACSKGTYVRTLCHDIGHYLGCGGTMSSLRRTRAGVFTQDEAVPLSEVEMAMADGHIEALMKPIDSLFSAYPEAGIDAYQKARCLNGADFAVQLDDGLYRVYDSAHAFMMLGEAKGGVMHTVRSFFDV
jgi:tRNA pseudouridine55 synthase